MHTQNFIKIHPLVLKKLRKNTFLHQSRAINLFFINKFSPFAILNHSSLISMSMQSLKTIGQKLLKSSETENAQTARTVQYPATLCVAGYKNRKWLSQRQNLTDQLTCGKWWSLPSWLQSMAGLVDQKVRDYSGLISPKYQWKKAEKIGNIPSARWKCITLVPTRNWTSKQ